MCGIVGYCGEKDAAGILVEGLKRLEYRGYDSSGISVGYNDKLSIIKKKGKISNLQAAVPSDMPGTFGIGHTRWATHGEVNDLNAHPHSDNSGKITIVHNGIIENYISIRKKLKDEGVKFITETDSEVIAQLVSKFYEGDLEKAVKEALKHLKGTYGIVAIHADEPNRLIGARNGSPLVLGIGEGEMFLASDVTAMISYTKQVVYMEDGDVVVVDKDGFRTTDIRDNERDKEISTVGWDVGEMEKEGYPTFMEKEIFEQPQAVLRGMKGRLDPDQGTAKLGGLNMTNRELRMVNRVIILAAGTSSYSAMTCAYLLEKIARIPASAELSSEIRYKNPIVDPGTLYFVVSQSGETADSLYAMRELQRKGATVLGICNVVGSTIPRESDGGVYIHSGPEIAVASTKAFTSQLTAMYLFSLIMARMRDMSISKGKAFVDALSMVPENINKVLEQNEYIKTIADKYADCHSFFFLGRGLTYPIALEGALKLKEISYIHAEGYTAGELKHGPIALINEVTPSVFLVPDDSLREKIISNMKEVKARKGPIIAVAVEGDTDVADIADEVIYVPKAHELMYPFSMVVALQVFAYHTAVALDRNVDQPRNLAKSVTVE
ncbi:MAG: glutamine--fructose-6-phosphate transaminase (isomerizing) [Spirochaetales bacterium]|uniref:Glutamine--fructose-6-phosphate aminotransferase [isomerizing] n=1 Tax=Candidatus Thalassospirochaeta sargassi TaxID=3119039 RepID=A0AAJ1IFC8_9SPIO|nr:glutamine--fructose-6-phosphate transaminase (isomerizing) [Spirochaetales bacterium]